MSAEQFTNNARTTLAVALGSVGDSLTVDGTDGFPPAPQFRIRIDDELLLVTGVAGATWAVARAIEDTDAASHAVGATVTQLLTAGALEVITALTADQPPHAVLAGPASGNTAAPAFRALTADDIPGLGNYQPLSANLTILANTPQSSFGLGLLSLANATAASTAVLPAQGGNANKVLGTDGTTVAWQTPAAPAYPISVGNGGTGVATLTGNQILLGNGTGAVKSIANGNATQTIGFTGAGNTPQAINFPGATTGSRYIGGPFNLSAGCGTFQNVTDGSGNVSVTIAESGIYDFVLNVQAVIQVASGVGEIATVLYNLATAAFVPNSFAVVTRTDLTGATGRVSLQTCYFIPNVPITANATIILQAYRNGSANFTISQLAQPQTAIIYTKKY